jgi:rod shape-determining protein MreC
MRFRNIVIVILLLLLVGTAYVPAIRREVGAGLRICLTGAEKGFSQAARSIKKPFSFFSSISQLRSENRELTEKLLSLQIDRSRVQELEYENSILMREIGFMGEHKDRQFVPAKIIGREPTSFLDYILIDKGTDDGIAPKQAVISGGALVGQVKEVFANQSKVTLITSKDSLILAMLQDSRATGILQGGISGLVLADVAADVDYKPGEYVITSGLDGEIEQGILIGTTAEIRSSSSGLYKKIVINPSINLSKLELVFVMK